MKDRPPSTLTERNAKIMIGKTFKYFWEGKVLYSGFVLNMLNNSSLLLFYYNQPDGEDDEVRSLNDCGFDHATKTGFKFSYENPEADTLVD
jgi:hypothetical protein